MDNEQPQTSTAAPDAPSVSEAPSVEAKPPHQPEPSKSGASSSSSEKAIWATGRRKEAIARVRLLTGTGMIVVNSRPYEQYFPREALCMAIRQPLLVTHQLGKYNVLARVEGGGLVGQAGAIKLGIARALTTLDPALRAPLRGAGLLTRDPRQKERKKYGQKGARKRFQWTKR